MHWYAVRVTYSRELFFKEYLDAEGIENYIPMRYEYVVRKERACASLFLRSITWSSSAPPASVWMK